MATISTNDILFASASQQGRSLANIRLSGMDSTMGVIAELRRLAGNTIGLVHVTLRNASQGWSRRLTLYLKPSSQPEGVQLSLF